MLIIKYVLYLILKIYMLCDLCIAENINILGIVSSTSISNHIHASALFDYLATTGNAVTVISPFPQSRRINHISLEDLLEAKKLKEDKGQSKFNSKQYSEHAENKETKKSSWGIAYDKYKIGLEQTENIVQHINFTELLTRHPPLYINAIILDYDYNEAFIGLGAIYNCPVFILTKDEPKGLLEPLNFTNLIKSSDNWFEQLHNIYESLIEKFYVNYFYLKKQEKLFNQFNTIEKNISFSKLLEQHLSKIFITSISSSILSSTTITDKIDVTGFHINDRKQSYLRQSYFTNIFPEALDKFIHSANSGIIYVSLDTELYPDLYENEINKIITVLKRRKEKIIWKWNGNISMIPLSLITKDKFYIDEWLPQTNMMEHLNIKLYITNCGHLSLIESLYFEIPIISLPITNEQKNFCHYIQHENVGEILDFKNFSIYQMNRTIGEILDKNSRFYMRNIQRISLELSEKPISPKKLIQITIKNVVEQQKIFGLKKTFLKKKSFYKALLKEPILMIIVLFILICLICNVFFILWIFRHFFRIYNENFRRRKCKFY